MSKIVYEVTVEDGNTFWRLNRKLHREDGPAVEDHRGGKYWYIDGEFHREDGPAAELATGSKHWYLNGKRHRLDGPAVDLCNGCKEWWIGGKEYTEAGYKKKIKAMESSKKACTDKVVEIDGVKYKLVKQ